MSYQYRAVEKFWRNFHKLGSEQKQSVRRAWQMFKRDPFHPSLGSHEIHELSARAKHTIYSAVIEANLRVIFRIDGSWATTLDVGTHKIYRAGSKASEVRFGEDAETRSPRRPLLNPFYPANPRFN